MMDERHRHTERIQVKDTEYVSVPLTHTPNIAINGHIVLEVKLHSVAFD
jgi:hypothetical protein